MKIYLWSSLEISLLALAQEHKVSRNAHNERENKRLLCATNTSRGKISLAAQLYLRDAINIVQVHMCARCGLLLPFTFDLLAQVASYSHDKCTLRHPSTIQHNCDVARQPLPLCRCAPTITFSRTVQVLRIPPSHPLTAYGNNTFQKGASPTQTTKKYCTAMC